MDMPAKKYIVELDAGERELLTGFISTGRAFAKAILKARLLLKADEAEGGPAGWTRRSSKRLILT
jgi:tartrate dehydratase beta subunit/fumarate hydratase class I family protein